MIFFVFLIFFFPLYLSFKLYRYITNKKIDPVGKTVLVTGGCSGIGKSIVQNLLKQGCIVFAADIKLDETMKDGNLHLLKMDVNDQQDVDSAVKYITKITNGKLFAIVNNAGIGFSREHKYVKSVGEMDIETEVLPVFNVNIIGMMRVTKSFLPLLHNNKEENPCVVNMASVAGLTNVQFFGAYCLTKHAVVSYSECLRKELFRFLRVVCVEPYFAETPLVSEKIKVIEANKDQSIIGDLVEEDYPLMFNYIDKMPKLSVDDVSIPTIREMFSTNNKAHLPIVKHYSDHLLILFYQILPAEIFDPVFRFVAKYLGKK